MPVSVESALSGPFTPNGVTTAFAFTFKAASASEVAVVDQDGTALSSALYSVELDDDEGGEVTFSVAPEAADYDELYIISEPSLTQAADFDNAGASFNPAALTRALDRAAVRDLRIQADVDRALKVPFGESVTLMPGAAARAGKYLAFDASGDVTASAGTGADDGLRTDLAAPVSGNGADLVEYSGGTASAWFNILNATRRPAMDGIFSSASDQRTALNDFITAAAADGKTIEWGPIDVSLDVETGGTARGLVVPAGSRWVMHPDTRIRALPNDADNYEIINIRDVRGVVIEGNGAKLIGERDDHTGGTGEHGHGLLLRGVTDVVVRDLIVEDCWGDGFYIGSSTSGGNVFCQDVLLENIRASNCRRQGLSLISAKNFLCTDSVFELTNGTNPQQGVDIEPNDPAEFLQNIEFRNCLTKNNEAYGIGVFLASMVGTANPVDIRIVDHRDDGSNCCVFAGLDEGIPGLIEIVRPLSLNAQGPGIIARNKRADGPRLTISDPDIIDWNRDASGSASLGSGILIYAPNGDSGTGSIGGVDILRPRFKLNSGSGTNAIGVFEQRATTPDEPSDIRIMEPRDMAGLDSVTRGTKTFTDPNRASVRALTDASVTIGTSSAARHYTIPALASSRNFSIDNTQAIGLEMTFEVIGSGVGQGRIGLPAGVNIAPDAITDDTGYIYSTQIGAKLTLRKHSAALWIVTEKIGTWTAV